MNLLKKKLKIDWGMVWEWTSLVWIIKWIIRNIWGGEVLTNMILQIDFMGIMEPQPNHKTLPIWVKRVRLLPNATPTRVLLKYTSPALSVWNNHSLKKRINGNFLHNFYFVIWSKVRPYQEHSCAILSSFKIMIIFNNTSADFVLISADVTLKKSFL